MKKIFTIIISSLLLSFLFAENPSVEEAALTYFKKINDTHTRLTYINKKTSLGKLGCETINGLVSGTLFYDAKIKGIGGLVVLRYTNYCDEDGWIFDGEILTNANMAQNGFFTGIVKMKTPDGSDTPELEVCYDNVLLKKGAPGEGYYLVTFPGSEPVKIDYSMYQKSLQTSGN